MPSVTPVAPTRIWDVKSVVITLNSSVPPSTKDGLPPVLPENEKLVVATLLVRAVSVPDTVGLVGVPPTVTFALPAVTLNTPLGAGGILLIFASKLLISNGTDQVFAPADVIYYYIIK